ncbi:MAG: AbrB/MazE/SpoVT family DNA-binding domain-containing protein [Desulfobacterales bacterium]
MLAKIQKWGNSQGLRLAKNLLADAQLGVGDEVDITVKDGIMIVTPARRIRGRYKLQDLWPVCPKTIEPMKSTGASRWEKRSGKCRPMFPGKGTLS